MIQHYIDCTIGGTILSIIEGAGQTPDKATYPMTDVIVDISNERNGVLHPVQAKITFIGEKMCNRVSRFRTSDEVEIAFTPKCRERFKNGKVSYYCYNLGFRIYAARDEEQDTAQQPQW